MNSNLLPFKGFALAPASLPDAPAALGLFATAATVLSAPARTV